MSRYLSLNYYNGSLGGLQEKPAGSNDVPSPGGMSSLEHHWSHGLFGPPVTVTDAYAGTGDRYISGSYGNMYIPNAHESLYDDYRGPLSDRTEYTNTRGDPYFWESGGPAMNKGQDLVHHRHNGVVNPMTLPVVQGANMQTSFGRNVVPREGVQAKPSNIGLRTNTVTGTIENFEYAPQSVETNLNEESSIEFINDPQVSAPKPVSKPPLKPVHKHHNHPPQNKTCKKPPPKPSNPDTQKTSDVVLDQKKQQNKTAVILLLLGVLVCIDLWGEFTHVFIEQYLNKGKAVSWVRYAIYAMIATIGVIITVQQSGVKVPVCA